MTPTITLVLGAGASRAVSYASKRRILSPLDCDFFELLQKIDPASKDEPAVTELIAWILASGECPITSDFGHYKVYRKREANSGP
jgi:hypothetical protein